MGAKLINVYPIPTKNYYAKELCGIFKIMIIEMGFEPVTFLLWDPLAVVNSDKCELEEVKNKTFSII